MNSSRLPGKVLQKFGKISVLESLLIRLADCRIPDKIVVATTTTKQDDELARAVSDLGGVVFRGSETDVLDRYYRAALDHSLDVVVRVTADCPLLDSAIVDQLLEVFLREGLDFVSNSEPLPSTWPDGMDVSVFSFQSLEKAWRAAKLPSEREHVTFYFWKDPEFKTKRLDLSPDMSRYRLTVDYPEDLAFLQELDARCRKQQLCGLDRLAMHELIRLIETNSDLVEMNAGIQRGVGWQDAFRADLDFYTEQ